MGEFQRQQHKERRGDAAQLGPAADNGGLESAAGGQRHGQADRADGQSLRAAHLGDQGRQGQAGEPGEGRREADRRPRGEHQECGEGDPGQGELPEAGEHPPGYQDEPPAGGAGQGPCPVQARAGGAGDRGEPQEAPGPPERVA